MKISRTTRFAAALAASAMLLAGCSGSDAGKASQTSDTAVSSETASSEASSASTAKQSESIPGGKKYEATVVIKDYGTIKFVMDEGIAPETVENFVSLAQSGFYDNLTLHRIMEGFMIQGGDPRGNGTGGSSHQINGEFSSNGFDNSLKHVRGTVSMARSQDPNSASSQFFIMQEDNASLDGEYAAFGTVTEGMDVVDAIAKAAKPTDDNGTISKEEQPVIESITVTELDDSSDASSQAE